VPRSKRIVVDASVARSAGWESTPDAISRQCREVLEGILRICHRAVFSQECLAEWRRHRSGYARRWLVQMFSRRKVILAEAVQDDGFRLRLFAVAVSETDRTALEKDAHLIEAALGHDRIVLSRDEAIREILKVAAGRVRELRTIQWANPATEEGIVRWLEGGAKLQPSRRLGAS
jgi:hypothetical protein